MSLELAKSWATQSLRSAGARNDVLRSLDQAAIKGYHLTVIVAPGLMVNGKGCLARWTGSELVVMELSEGQQRGLGVMPNGLLQEALPRDESMDLPSERCVTLSDVRIETPVSYDGYTSLSGRCNFSFDDPIAAPVTSCALRAQYFHTGLTRQVTGFWYAERGLLPPGGELRYTLPPLASAKNPVSIRGALVVFVQLVTGQNWITREGSRTISNLAATVVGLNEAA